MTYLRWVMWLLIFAALGMGVIFGLGSLGLLTSTVVGLVVGYGLGIAAIIGAFVMTGGYF